MSAVVTAKTSCGALIRGLSFHVAAMFSGDQRLCGRRVTDPLRRCHFVARGQGATVWGRGRWGGGLGRDDSPSSAVVHSSPAEPVHHVSSTNTAALCLTLISVLVHTFLIAVCISVRARLKLTHIVQLCVCWR